MSALLFPQGKQKRDQAQPGQDRRGGESRGRDFRPGLKTLFEPRSHADQEGKQRHVEEDYAKRFFGLGRDLHRRNCRTSVPDANLNRVIASNFEPRSSQMARRDYALIKVPLRVLCRLRGGNRSTLWEIRISVFFAAFCQNDMAQLAAALNFSVL